VSSSTSVKGAADRRPRRCRSRVIPACSIRTG
jgi:hypothetical protein